MSTKDENIEKLKKLIEVLEKLQEGVHPDSTTLLQKISERYGKLQVEAQAILEDLSGVAQATQAKAMNSTPGKTKVYISLFQADPENLKAWEKTLRRIAEYSLSRPIYRKVEHVEQLIRARPDPRKEAYAEVIMADEDLIRGYAGKQESDAHGNELLTVKEGSMKPANVVKFIHGDHTYLFQDEKLVLENNSL